MTGAGPDPTLRAVDPHKASGRRLVPVAVSHTMRRIGPAGLITAAALLGFGPRAGAEPRQQQPLFGSAHGQACGYGAGAHRS